MRRANQQSSNSLRSKRENFRNQIRREQLQAIFKAKRLELMQERQQDERFHVYQKVEESIEKYPNDMETIDFVIKEIKDLCERFPLEKRNFALIGSFLLKNQSKLFEFESELFREENFGLSNTIEYVWAFGIYLTILCNLMQSQQIENSLHQLQKIDRYLSGLINKYWQCFKISKKNVDVMQIYVLCLELFFYNFANKSFFPICSFIEIISILGQFLVAISQQQLINTRQIKLCITSFINNAVAQIKEKQLYSDDIREFLTQQQARYLIPSNTMEKLIKASGQIFFENLFDSSDSKQQCIASLKILCECSPINAGEYLFQKKHLKHYQFLILNHKPVIKQNLLSSINSILPFITKSRLLEFLDQSLHINMIEALNRTLSQLFKKQLKFSQKICSEIVFYLLKFFSTLLLKVEQLGSSVFRKVFHTMNDCRFADAIDSMGSIRFEEKIEEIWSNIVDTYFSEDMCEQSHQKQNYCNSMNASESMYQYQNKENHQQMHYHQTKQKRESDYDEQFII